MEQRYLADSNSIIDYVGNKMPDKALLILDGYFNDNVTISIISKIEILGFNDTNAWILATGSTSVRTRLYRMGITNNLADIEIDFIVLGYNKNEEWEKFIVGEDYEAFLLTKKIRLYDS